MEHNTRARRQAELEAAESLAKKALEAAEKRIILHCDCNSFYASVELLEYPDLREKPVAVCGDAESRHGIILAKNEAAKKYGIQTAETIWQAQRKCRELVLLSAHHEKYIAISKKINDIYKKYTDRVEPFSVDESWLDVTHTLHLFEKSGKDLADRIRREVQQEIGITISVGVSYNKVLAKFGSDYKKPNATTVIGKEELHSLVWPMPVERLLFVGGKTADTLHTMGISTIGQLAEASAEELFYFLGKQGPQLRHYARGEDTEPVHLAEEQREVKSVGNSMTFKRNLCSVQDRKIAVLALTDKVASRLRSHGLYAETVQISVKDPRLQVRSRQKKLPLATCLAKDMAKASMELLEETCAPGEEIRMLSVTAANLTDNPGPAQLNFLEPQPAQRNRKQETLEKALDGIRKKYGRSAIGEASILHNDLGIDLCDPKHEETEE